MINRRAEKILNARILTAFLLLFASASSAEKRTYSKAAVRQECAEDLGPDEIDVSHYPEKYQRVYRDIFIPVFGIRREKARMINSPIIELDSRLRKAELRAHPALFADSTVAQPSADGWKKKVQQVYMRPACCGACPVITRAQAKELWEFMVYDSLVRKTGPNADGFIRLRKGLLDRFNRQRGDINLVQ